MNADEWNNWVWANGDVNKSIARLFLIIFTLGAVLAGAVVACYVLPWWLTMPPLGYVVARCVWWTIR